MTKEKTNYYKTIMGESRIAPTQSSKYKQKQN